ncbi:MAG: helix-turn-helix transcriptional regulator [Polyangiaceae bacterium]|nr:helix-turn-helix transcriptional regulator [Polyangiaceae bacterium]
MLDATGRISFDGGEYCLHVGLERQLWMVTFCRRGVVWDTRILPPWPHSLHDQSGERYYLLLDGRFEFFGESSGVLDAPCAFRASAGVFEGVGDERPVQVRTSGEPLRVFALHVLPTRATRASGPVAEWARLDVPDDVLARCDAFELEARLQGCGPTLDRRRRALLERLHEIGWLSADVLASIVEDEPPHLARTWNAFTPIFRDLTMSPALSELAERATRSPRQFDRNFDELLETFHLVGDGFRNTIQRLRLSMAILMLGTEPATVASVARAVGYARPEAMTSAFRAVGLPAPSAVREFLRQHRDA